MYLVVSLSFLSCCVRNIASLQVVLAAGVYGIDFDNCARVSSPMAYIHGGTLTGAAISSSRPEVCIQTLPLNLTRPTMSCINIQIEGLVI